MPTRAQIPTYLHCFTWAISLFCLSTNASHAQSSAIEAGMLYGKMLDIFANFPDRGPHSGIAIGYTRKRASPASERYGHPETGVCISFHDLGNRNVLGLGLGVQYEMNFHQSLTQRLELTERFRAGGIYNTRPYDQTTNAGNIVNGSGLAFLMGTAVGVRYHLSPHSLLRLDGSIWHSSNGHTALPNVGMNSPLVQLSYQYRFENGHLPDTSLSSATFLTQRSWTTLLYGALGWNEAGGTVRPTNAPRYFKYLGGIGVGLRVRQIHRWTLSLEGYYDQTNRIWNESQEWTSDNPVWQSSVVMLMLGHEFIYQRFGLLINAGLNIYNPTLQHIEASQGKTSFFNQVKVYMPGRFAMRYYFSHPWRRAASGFAQISIKSHFGQADYLEFGIGYLIRTRKGQ